MYRYRMELHSRYPLAIGNSFQLSATPLIQQPLLEIRMYAPLND